MVTRRHELARFTRLGCLLAAGVTLQPNAAVAQSFEGLGFFVGGEYSSANGVSADGRVVVGQASKLNQPNRAFRWTATTGMIDLGLLPGANVSAAFGVSDDGTVVAGNSGNVFFGDYLGFRWTEAGGMVTVGDLPGGSEFSGAWAVSADGGTVVGFSSSTSAPLAEAYRWTTREGIVGLGFANPRAFFSAAYDVSADGLIVAGTSHDDALRFQAVRWSEPDGFTLLGFLYDGSVETGANAISGDGATIVGSDIRDEPKTLFEAFRWTEADGLVGLGVPPDCMESGALDVSFDGSVVIGAALTNAEEHVAFVWDQAHGMRRLEQVLVEAGLGDAIAGWRLVQCNAVSADGLTLVGTGFDPQGRTQAWRARLACLADLSGDGVVDQADLGLVLAGYGCTKGDCVGDADGDGDTDQSDLGLVLNRYGQPCP